MSPTIGIVDVTPYGVKVLKGEPSTALAKTEVSPRRVSFSRLYCRTSSIGRGMSRTQKRGGKIPDGSRFITAGHAPFGADHGEAGATSRTIVHLPESQYRLMVGQSSS